MWFYISLSTEFVFLPNFKVFYSKSNTFFFMVLESKLFDKLVGLWSWGEMQKN